MSVGIFFNIHALGHIIPTLSLVKELKKMEQTIYYITDNRFRHIIEQTGVNFIDNRVYRVLEIVNYNTNPSNNLQKHSTIISIRDLYDKFIRNHIIIAEYAAKLIDKINPDYIIHDSYAYWVRLLKNEHGLPMASSIPTLTFCKEMLYHDPTWVINNIYGFDIKKEQASNVLMELNDLSKDLSDKYKINIDVFNLMSCHQDYNLIYTTRQLHPYGNLFGNNYHFAGNDLRYREALFEKTDDIVKHEGSNFIVFSFGSILTQNESYIDFYKELFNTLGKLPYYFIVNVGKLISFFNDIPTNIELAEYINQLELLQKADLLITHGGMNSISEAITYSVPMIVIPQIADEFSIANVIEKEGMGIVLRNKDDFKSLVLAIREIINNENYKKCIKIHQKFYKEASNANLTAKNLLDYLLSTR
jgi:MGT family glycosyltransferase